MSVSLTPTLGAFIRRKVAEGLFGNASEVVREAFRRQIEAEKAAVPKGSMCPGSPAIAGLPVLLWTLLMDELAQLSAAARRTERRGRSDDDRA